MKIRNYCPDDCNEIVDLFYNTVHTINAQDYTKTQLDAWASKSIDISQWNQSFLNHYSIVAIENDILVGFGDIDSSGYLDRLYVHKDYQKHGIATALCNELEKSIPGKITTHASITAKPFFEKRGYHVVKKQEVIRKGILLVNYVMEKDNN